jgi:hypothetical protein
MNKIKFLFVLFSLVALAAPAHAQEREGGERQGRGRGSVIRGRGDENDRESRRAHEDDDDERGDRIERSRRGGDEDEDNERDDDESRAGISRSGCIDQRGNNVCDLTLPAATLPEMINAVLVSRGQLTQNGAYWLGNSVLSPRYQSAGKRGPSQVAWLDRSGRVAQVWLDSNRDGRADMIKMYRGGRLVRTVRRN